MSNNLNFQFGMYEPSTDSIIVNTSENSILVIRCKECNSAVIFNAPNDVVYLFRLAEEGKVTMDSLTYWGFVDQLSWRKERSPMPFNMAMKPKYALYGILQMKELAGFDE